MKQVFTMPLQVNIDKLTEMCLFGKCLFVCLFYCTVLVEVILAFSITYY